MKLFIPKDQQMSIKELEEKRDRNKVVGMDSNHTNKLRSRNWRRTGYGNNKNR